MAHAQRLGVRVFLPSELRLTVAMREAIAVVGCRDPDAAFQHFRDVHTKKASKFADWSGAVWRTWIANHGKYGCPCERAASQAATGPTLREIAARATQRKREKAQRAAMGG